MTTYRKNLSNLLEIKRILWHELGHLCVRLVMNDKIENHSITSLNVKYTNYIGEDKFPWSGSVNYNPATKVDDDLVVAYTMISLFTGCVFETIYFNEIIGNTDKKVEDCFG